MTLMNTIISGPPISEVIAVQTPMSFSHDSVLPAGGRILAEHWGPSRTGDTFTMRRGNSSCFGAPPQYRCIAYPRSTKMVSPPPHYLNHWITHLCPGQENRQKLLPLANRTESHVNNSLKSAQLLEMLGAKHGFVQSMDWAVQSMDPHFAQMIHRSCCVCAILGLC